MFDHQITRRAFAGLVTAAPLGFAAETSEWTNLFDGQTLNGWRPSENKSSWTVVDGALTANGPRSHLFYTGPVRAADFRNFELEVELTTQPDCNSGVYFHTAYQESGFPEKGFEVQVNNTAHGDRGYLERKKTGSLYGLRNMYKQLVPDGKPFTMHIAVRGKNIQIRLNGELLIDYWEPTPPVVPEGAEKMRFLDHGTFALQCHNDGSRVAYRKVRVRPLSDNLPAYAGTPPLVDDTFRSIINIGRHNIPMVDYHVSLRNGLTLQDALRKSRKDGIQYGITAPSTALKNDVAAARWLGPITGKPVFCGLYIEDRNWTRAISRTTAQRFDYVLATSHAGANPEEIIERLSNEPIDIFALLHANTAWTDSQMDKLMDALLKNQVAIEINSREQLPSQAFIERAKQAGCKFGFGTGNQTAAELKRSEYGLRMVEACKLDWHAFFVPGAWWPKALLRESAGHMDRRWPA